MGGYRALPSEFLVTGLVGIFLYLALFGLSLQSLVSFGRFRSKSTKRFFFCLLVMSLCELPRFFGLAVDREYTSRTTYCFHLVAGIAFFGAFSIVVRQWSGLLTLGAAKNWRHYQQTLESASTSERALLSWRYTAQRVYATLCRAMYSAKSLVVCNLVFAGIDIFAMVLCAKSHSLQAYFFSDAFVSMSFVEAVRNTVYALFLSYFGVKLIRRFWHFALVERQALQRMLSSGSALQRERMSASSSSSYSSSTYREGEEEEDDDSEQVIEFSRFDDEREDKLRSSIHSVDSLSVSVQQQRARERATQSSSWCCSSSSSSLCCLCCSPSSLCASFFSRNKRGVSSQQQQVFTKVVLRLGVVLVLVTLCFLVRLSMLLVKMTELRSETASYTSRTFPLFGMLWFCCSDFIPRWVPCLALVLLMRARKPSKRSLAMNGHDYAQQAFRQEEDTDSHRSLLAAAAASDERTRDTHSSEMSTVNHASSSVNAFLFARLSAAEDGERGETSPARNELSRHLLQGIDNEEEDFEAARARVLSVSASEAAAEEEETSLHFMHQHVSLSALDAGFRDDLSDFSEDEEDGDDDVFADVALDRLISLISTKSR